MVPVGPNAGELLVGQKALDQAIERGLHPIEVTREEYDDLRERHQAARVARLEAQRRRPGMTNAAKRRARRGRR